MTKWFIEYSIIEYFPLGDAERDGDEFFHTNVDKINLPVIEAMITNIATKESCSTDDVLIVNIAKINGN